MDSPDRDERYCRRCGSAQRRLRDQVCDDEDACAAQVERDRALWPIVAERFRLPPRGDP